ncbi:MFS transporter [Thiorhodospira sibirica]|uniref:MFS transporter n=1 Tax=Thiorhodospira sibirica TaxID=154347 RepID=UPI00022C231A|nr:MFS transporter [Thiorhodospira sibirica]
MPSDTAASHHKIGFIHLAPHVLPYHGWSFFYAAFFSIGLIAFITIGQTYILNEHLGIPIEQQGTLSGDLVFWTEIVALLLFIPAGLLIDRIGRRPIYMAGFLLLGATYVLYPLASSSEDLFWYRIVYAMGVVAVAGGLSTVLADYPAERSRGKLVAIIGMLNGLGIVVISQFFGGLPDWFSAHGIEGMDAGLYTHLALASLALLTALVVMIGLKGGVPVHTAQRPPYRVLLLSGLAEGRNNPRVLLSYAAAFIARGDQSINATFLVLWGTTAGLAAGMSSGEAIKQGTIIFVIAQIAALFSAPVIGPFIDRVNRVTALAVCMGMAALGNLAIILLVDPLASQAIIFFILMGIGQMSVFLSAQSLIGQEAPADKRGSVLAAFNISGALGILLIVLIGGRLFDHIGPQAPFVLVGCINILLVFASVYVRRHWPGHPPNTAVV